MSLLRKRYETRNARRYEFGRAKCYEFALQTLRSLQCSKVMSLLRKRYGKNRHLDTSVGFYLYHLSHRDKYLTFAIAKTSLAQPHRLPVRATSLSPQGDTFAVFFVFRRKKLIFAMRTKRFGT